MGWTVTIGDGVIFIGAMVVLAVGLIWFGVLWIKRVEQMPLVGALAIATAGIPIFCIVERGKKVVLLSGNWWMPFAAIGALVLIFIIGYNAGGPSSSVGQKKAIRAVLILVMIGGGLYAIQYLVKNAADWGAQYAAGEAAANPRLNYGGGLCPGAFQTSVDNGRRDDITHFSISLREGCWSGWVVIPGWWQGYNLELSGVDSWVAGWPESMTPSGPFRANQRISFCAYCPNSFRFQGRGTLTFYTNKRSPRRKRDGSLNMYGEPIEESESSDTGAKPAPPPHESKSPLGTKKEIDQMFFTLGECRLNGDYLTCEFDVTNRGKEQQLEISTSSRVFDSTGHEHTATRATIGAEQFRFGGVGNRMPTDVPIACSIGFSQVPADSTEIKLLEFDTNLTRRNGDRKLKFYNVPIAK